MKLFKITILTFLIFCLSTNTTSAYIDPSVFGSPPSSTTILGALSPIIIAITAFIIKPIKNLIKRLSRKENEKSNHIRT